jgi:hypothetical protein
MLATGFCVGEPSSEQGGTSYIAARSLVLLLSVCLLLFLVLVL